MWPVHPLLSICVRTHALKHAPTGKYECHMCVITCAQSHKLLHACTHACTATTTPTPTPTPTACCTCAGLLQPRQRPTLQLQPRQTQLTALTYACTRTRAHTHARTHARAHMSARCTSKGGSCGGRFGGTSCQEGSRRGVCACLHASRVGARHLHSLDRRWWRRTTLRQTNRSTQSHSWTRMYTLCCIAHTALRVPHRAAPRRSIALHRTVLHRTAAPHRTVPYCTASHQIKQHGTRRHGMVCCRALDAKDDFTDGVCMCVRTHGCMCPRVRVLDRMRACGDGYAPLCMYACILGPVRARCVCMCACTCAYERACCVHDLQGQVGLAGYASIW